MDQVNKEQTPLPDRSHPRLPAQQQGQSFTPGPWRDGQDGNCRVYGPDGQGEHSGLIAVVYKGRANAHLIAAAPALYAALVDLVRQLPNDERLADFNLDQAEAAILMADGQRDE